MKILILLVFGLNCFESVKKFQCQQNQQSLSIDLNQMEENLGDKFGIGFWIQSQNFNINLFSLDSLVDKVIFTLNQEGRLQINGNVTTIKSFKTSNAYQVKWNYMYLFVQRNQSDLNVSVFSNDIMLNDQKLSFSGNKQNFYLTLGATGFQGNCYTFIDFRSVTFYPNQPQKNTLQILEQSTGTATPIYLAKPNKEQSYTKFFENLINNHVGPIKNGVANNNFTYFTSLSTMKNSFKQKQHLISGLALFLMPKDLLDQRDLNQSYVFVIHYKFFYQDYQVSKFDNVQNHCLYQRFSSQNVDILIRSDLEVKMGNSENSVTQRDFIDQQIVNTKTYNLTLVNDGSLKQFPLNYQLVRVQNNPLLSVPRISFVNGYDNVEKIYNNRVTLNTDDRHLFGDSVNRNTTRKEYFSFISIMEIAFYRGAEIKTLKDKDMIFVSGQNSIEYVLACKNQSDPQRISGNNLVMNTCSNQELNPCELIDQSGVNEIMNNCDVCTQDTCLICAPGYQLTRSGCQKCQNGYDPITKSCFDGQSLSQFYGTQFGNLNSVLVKTSLQNQIFVATAKLQTIPNVYNYNALLMFYNNVDDQNRVIDTCWQTCDLNQELYLTQVNNIPQFDVSNIVIGNTGNIATTPKEIIYIAKNTSDYRGVVHKNFSCDFLGENFYMKMQSPLIGQCVTECGSGYFKDDQSRRCLRCPSNCMDCVNSQVCISCREGQFLQDGFCENCQSPCKTCVQNSNLCLSCSQIDQFNQSSNSCDKLCQNKDPNCNSCDFRTGLCLSCNYGYQLSNNRCRLQNCDIGNCAMCLSPLQCSRCDRGYSLLNGKCILCRTNCTACPVGYDIIAGACQMRQNNEIIYRNPRENLIPVTTPVKQNKSYLLAIFLIVFMNQLIQNYILSKTSLMFSLTKY